MLTGLDTDQPADNEKYQLTNDKWKMLFFPDSVIY